MLQKLTQEEVNGLGSIIINRSKSSRAVKTLEGQKAYLIQVKLRSRNYHTDTLLSSYFLNLKTKIRSLMLPNTYQSIFKVKPDQFRISPLQQIRNQKALKKHVKVIRKIECKPNFTTWCVVLKCTDNRILLNFKKVIGKCQSLRPVLISLMSDHRMNSRI